MDFFSEALSRLKHELRVSKDQEVAEALGMKKTAFSERKKRGAFPGDDVRNLAQRRPELGVDVQYVLTGQRTEPHTKTALDLLGKVASEMGGDARLVRLLRLSC